jgi:RHS repeat-associated protein
MAISLVSTVDQQFASGTATGTPQTLYIHPDHLGSTNVVTNASETVVETLDYYPYGEVRINTSTAGADSARKYIGQFADDSGLNYFNARYYSSDRGQFISQDPTFLAIGNSDQIKQLSNQEQSKLLSDPQQLNSYGYVGDNPITRKDPRGLWYKELITRQQSWPSFQLELGEAADQLVQDNAPWNFAFNHPVETGVAVGAGRALAAQATVGGLFVNGVYAGATHTTIGILNAVGYEQTAQSYIQYRATGSQSSLNQVIFDALVSGSAALGTIQEREALNLLSAALTALSNSMGNTPAIVNLHNSTNSFANTSGSNNGSGNKSNTNTKSNNTNNSSGSKSTVNGIKSY